MDALGRAIKRLREERGMSASKLGRAADLSNPVIFGIENGTANPTVATLEKLAGVFGLTATELMSIADEERKGR